MGLERVTACLNSKVSNYDTDLFIPLFNVIHKISKKPRYQGVFPSSGECLDTFYRILADHSRMITVALADGLLPHDSYILRRAIRRCLLIGWEKFGLHSHKNFMSYLIASVAETFRDTYPEIERNFNNLKYLLEYEEVLLKEVHSQTSKEWSKVIQEHPQLSSLTNVSPKLIEALKELMPSTDRWRQNGNIFPSDEACELCIKYHISYPLMEDVAEVLGLKLDLQKFLSLSSKKSDSKQENLKDPSSFIGKDFAVDLFINNINIRTTDDSHIYDYSCSSEGSYSYKPHQSEISAIILGNNLVSEVKKGDEVVIILNSTNFYSSAGGQSSDRGFIKSGENTFKVTKVEKFKDYVFHFGQVTSGNFRTGEEVSLHIDKGVRLSCSRLHTAHHLFVGAIKSVVGMAYQRESKVSSNNFILDLFTYPHLELDQIAQAEEIVKSWIQQGSNVSRKTLFFYDALRLGNPSLVSGALYPDDVHIISTSCDLPLEKIISSSSSKALTQTHSSELCCGTHIFNTSHLESFAITNIENRSNGIFRITAICGKNALTLNSNAPAILKKIKEWENKITMAINKNERIRGIFSEFRKWKSSIKKSEFQFTVYQRVINKADYLIELMNTVLKPESNWEELKKEFLEIMNEHPQGPILHQMRTEYRGNQDNLATIMNETSGRPAAFVCKGWGKVRACVYIPKESQNEHVSVVLILEELQKSVGKGSINLDENSMCIGTYMLGGVKQNEIENNMSNIRKVCTDFFSKLST